ncbi:RES domain-containing protein [Bdellovibrionota bacterium FG-1]
MTLKIADHPARIYRVGREDPWVIRPPRLDNRFDISDPESPVMTLYTGESPDAALAEVLVQFRPDLEAVVAVAAIPSDDVQKPLCGLVPRGWLARRRMGQAKIRPEAVLVDITASESIAALRAVPALAEKALACGFADIDESSLKASGLQGRTFTQTVAAHLYNNQHSGIRYGSRLGADYHCIAGFVSVDSADVTESDFIIEVEATMMITPDDPALHRVAKIFELRI